MPTKKDRWAEVIETLHLDLARPINYVSAKQIRETIHEEARLMTSISSERELPEILRSQNVFIVPLSSTGYALVHGKGYHELEDPGDPQPFKSRLPIRLATLGYGEGESRFLLHAYHSGLISHFSGVPQLYTTILGKRRTGSFTFNIDGVRGLAVDGAGMEVDIGFEGTSDLILFEAKVRARATFLTRQLYYPYRAFSKSQSKRVRPMFFVAEPDLGTYSMWEYEWDDPTDYEGIRLCKAARFRVEDQFLPESELDAIEPDPSLVIVPQANDFGKVAEVPALVLAGKDNAKKWAENYGYAVRQGGYYPEAAEALGLISRKRGKFTLTEEGRRLTSIPAAERDEYLARRLLRTPLMNSIFRLALDRGKAGVGDREIVERIQALSSLRSSTPIRRAQSVRSYFRWLAQATGAVIVQNRRIYSRTAWEATFKADPRSDQHPEQEG